MKKIAYFAILCVIILCGFVIYKTLQIPENPTHYHANFAVFINNQQINFSDPSYMHLKPCRAEDITSDNKIDNVHLHDLVGNIVHVHQDGITWKDLFKSIQYDLDKELNNTSNTKVYIDDKLVGKEALNSEIGKNSRLLISIGNEPATLTASQNEILKAQYEKVGTNAHEYDTEKGPLETCAGTKKRSFVTRIKIALKTIFN